jgi:hypothetical protein
MTPPRRRSHRVTRAPPARDAASTHSAVRHLDDEGGAELPRAEMARHNKAVLDDHSRDKGVRRHGGFGILGLHMSDEAAAAAALVEADLAAKWRAGVWRGIEGGWAVPKKGTFASERDPPPSEAQLRLAQRRHVLSLPGWKGSGDALGRICREVPGFATLLAAATEVALDYETEWPPLGQVELPPGGEHSIRRGAAPVEPSDEPLANLGAPRPRGARPRVPGAAQRARALGLRCTAAHILRNVASAAGGDPDTGHAGTGLSAHQDLLRKRTRLTVLAKISAGPTKSRMRVVGAPTFSYPHVRSFAVMRSSLWHESLPHPSADGPVIKVVFFFEAANSAR